MGGITSSIDVPTSSGGIYKKKGGKGGGSTVGLDVSDKSGMSRDDLLEENVRLTQLLLDVSFFTLWARTCLLLWLNYVSAKHASLTQLDLVLRFI